MNLQILKLSGNNFQTYGLITLYIVDTLSIENLDVVGAMFNQNMPSSIFPCETT